MAHQAMVELAEMEKQAAADAKKKAAGEAKSRPVATPSRVGEGNEDHDQLLRAATLRLGMKNRKPQCLIQHLAQGTG